MWSGIGADVERIWSELERGCGADWKKDLERMWREFGTHFEAL